MFSFDNNRAHNFSLGVLDTYYKMNELLLKKKVTVKNEYFVINRGMKKSIMVHGVEFDEKSKEEIAAYQKQGVVYSLHHLDFLDKKTESRFIEIGYDLAVVFDGATYPNSKKRHQKIVYPFKYLEKEGYAVRTDNYEDVENMLKFHDIWVEHKLNDPKTFRNMFPNKRYANCIISAANADSGKIINPKYKLFSIYNSKNEIVAVRVVAIQNDTAYDLAFFGNTWNAPSQLINYIEVVTLKMLMEQNNTRHFNCGLASSPTLKNFKKHIPSYDIISYRYKKLNEPQKVKEFTGFGL